MALDSESTYNKDIVTSCVASQISGQLEQLKTYYGRVVSLLGFVFMRVSEGVHCNSAGSWLELKPSRVARNNTL